MAKFEQLNIDGSWDPVSKEDIDMNKIIEESMDNFNVCPICGNDPCTCDDECPLGGDLNDDCVDCPYRADYHYDHKTGDCVKNDEEESDEE